MYWEEKRSTIQFSKKLIRSWIQYMYDAMINEASSSKKKWGQTRQYRFEHLEHNENASWHTTTPYRTHGSADPGAWNRLRAKGKHAIFSQHNCSMNRPDDNTK